MFSFRRAAVAAAAAAFVFAATPAICADTASPNAHSLALARQLFTEMKMDRMLDTMVQQMTPAMIAQAKRTNPNLTEAQLDAISSATVETMAEVMPRMIDKFVPLYAQTFSEKELQDLVNFYGTSSGQAMIDKMPTLMGHLTPLMNEMLPEVTVSMTRHLCQKIDCSKAAAPPLQPKT